MTEALIGLIAFIAIALIGWAIAVGKNNVLTYEATDEELQAEEAHKEKLNASEGKELGIRDILRDSTFKGFKAI